MRILRHLGQSLSPLRYWQPFFVCFITTLLLNHRFKKYLQLKGQFQGQQMGSERGKKTLTAFAACLLKSTNAR